MTSTSNHAAPRWYNSLRARVTLLLSLAVLPIGFIAVFQTSRLSDSANHNSELALLALSDQAVQNERLLIQRAFGAGDMLGNLVPLLLQNPEECVPYLRQFLMDEPDFSFAGVLPLDGVMTCSSVEETLDFSGYATWPGLVADPRPNVVLNPLAPGSETAVIVVSMPYDIDGNFAGYISISVPQTKLADREAFADLPVAGLIELFTFNDTGDVITAENSIDAAEELLPKDLDKADFAVETARSFRANSTSGEEYIYTLVPVSDSPITILGVWNPSQNVDARLINSPLLASSFPLIMWVASVLVATMALYTLVIRHIAVLRRQMIDFAEDRTVPAKSFDSSVPNELVDIQSRFLAMTDDIVREEARLEAMVREQNVLMKEVHHRVKNNLQMIASIMNMQIRNAEHDETAQTLQRVQDRITALADVHKDLYTTEDEGRINAGALMNRTIQNSIEVGVADVGQIDLTKAIDDVWMYPDQVVPLSLLASEALTNAIKYMSSAEGQKPIIEVSLKRVNDNCQLRVANSAFGGTVAQGTGIGSKLIRAFSIKLGGQPDILEQDDMYVFQLDFPISDFQLENVDY